MVTKLKQLLALTGYSDVDSLITATERSIRVSGICMNRRCTYVREVEKDQKHGYCEVCGTETVKSALMLTVRPIASPSPERPPEVFAVGTADRHLSDGELVQFVTGVKASEAQDLLHKFGGASAIIGASASEMAARGVNGATARRIQVFQEAAAAHHWRKIAKRVALSSWNELLDYLSVGLAAKCIEEFHVLFLDRKNALLSDEVMGRGTVDHAPVYPREILRRALALNASALILAHNHPSGDPTPSRADIDMTREVIEACKALRIAVHDHLVIGRTGTASFKALGLM